MDKTSGTSDLDSGTRQTGNQQWWTDNTMSYDWNDAAAGEKFSEGWYRDIDARFLHGARLFLDAANPFESLIGTDALAGKRVLEIGCGMGMHSEMMLRAGANLTSIDLSPTSVASTTRRLALRDVAGADVRQMDAEKLAFDAGEFDLVWSWGVIHHSASTAKALREVHRVLKPGGEAKIMVYATDGLTAYMVMVKYLLGFWRGQRFDDLLWRNADGFTARFYTEDNWRDLFGLFFEDITTRLCGQDADAVPLPRQLRRPLLRLFSDARLRAMATQRGSMLFATGRKPA